MLIAREYRSGILDSALQKARAIPRAMAIRQVALAQSSSTRPKFVVSFDPRLPNITSITQKHWRAMRNMDSYLADVFPKPPMIAYRRPENLRDKLVRAKLSKPSKYQTRRKLGMKKCGKPFCDLCPFVKEGNKVKMRNRIWYITRHLNCESSNICYLIECQKDKCKERYIGETEHSLRTRFTQHRGYVNNNQTKRATGYHFNLPGHSVSDMKVTILEKVKYNTEAYRKQREKLLISQFDTFNNGLNRMV